MNLKPLVNNKDLWDSFLEHIEQEKQKVYRSFTLNRDTEEMLRLQGQAICLSKLEKLRESVNGSE